MRNGVADSDKIVEVIINCCLIKTNISTVGA